MQFYGFDYPNYWNFQQLAAMYNYCVKGWTSRVSSSQYLIKRWCNLDFKRTSVGNLVCMFCVERHLMLLLKRSLSGYLTYFYTNSQKYNHRIYYLYTGIFILKRIL